MLPETQTVLQVLRRHLLGQSASPASSPSVVNSPSAAEPPIVISQAHVKLVPPAMHPALSDDECAGASPDVSALPSSANLLGLERQAAAQRRRQNTLRQLSVTVHIPHSAKSKSKEAARSVLSGLARVPALILLLYIFICSLDFLTTAFRLIAGKAAGEVFQSSELLSNPIVGLMIGVLFTVLVQSSSTCTSVIVSMVSSGILEVRTAIPMIMGANIGTSLTSTLVSLTQMGDKGQFELAFAGATVHDCFNWLTVMALLPLEVATGYLYTLTHWITQSSQWMASGGKEASKVSNINILGAITKPLTENVVQIDKKVLDCWGLGQCHDQSLLKVWCKKPGMNVTNNTALNEDDSGEKCAFLLNLVEMSDTTAGIILLIASLLSLTGCLILIVKILHSLLQGAVANLIRKSINADIPYMPWMTGYIAILMGAILTFIVQSSSVFTSTLTPLVGVGLITVERVYPLTLGSNVGTTTTAFLASLAADPQRFQSSIQIALCHLLFNLSGILLFYPLPFMRWPLTLCRILGRTTANYRWFAVFYLIFMFFLLPGFVLIISMAGPVCFLAVAVPLLVTLLVVVVVNVMQVKAARFLPAVLRTWGFLPLWMHSLDPVDAALWRLYEACCCCCAKYRHVATEDEEEVNDNGLSMVAVE